MKKKPEHYLISLPLIPHDNRNLHCYLLTTNSQRDIENACGRMIDAFEEFVGSPIMFPMFVTTGPLKANTTKMVRDLLVTMPEVKETLKTAKDYHITVFTVSVEDDARLMEIH